MNGIIVINKPKDYTSFDVVAIMRRLLGEKKVGHTGTLDPMATGVLPILVGRATKLQSFILEADKEYIATFKLGMTTDTLDITGTVLTSVESQVEKRAVEDVLNSFRGRIKQVPPMYSAIQKNGVRLYDLARKGIKVEREAREVTINTLQLLNFDLASQIGTVLVNCSKGTYIRALCDDIGKKLGCGATLVELQRTKTGEFDIKHSITLDEAKTLASKNCLVEHLLPCDTILLAYPKVKVSQPQATRFKNGSTLSLDRLNFNSALYNTDLVRVYTQDNDFIGLAQINIPQNELSVSCLIDIS